MVDDARTCAVMNADEPLPGSAPVAGTHVFLEHLGPWPASSMEALDLNYAAELDELEASIGLVRRPTPFRTAATGIPERPYVIVSTAGRVALTRAAGLPSVSTLDNAIAAISRGELPSGWAYEPWLILVCTHARRDACCARLGRPLVDDLLAVTDQDRVWETTHLGGHRFAPTCLALPSQVVYGRVTSERAPEVAAAVAHHEVVPDLMRGRTTYSAALQAAEIVALTRLGIRNETLKLVTSSTDGDLTHSTWHSATSAVDVTIEKRQGRERQLSCGKDKLEARPIYVEV